MSELCADWTKTRNLYLNWLSKNKLKNEFFKNIRYENLSVWWITSVVERDNINDSNWYLNLHKRLNGNFFTITKYKFLYLKFLRKFFATLIFNFLITFFYKEKFFKYEKNKKLYCFHSHKINIQKYKKYFFDRQYGYASLKKKKQSCYLIQLENDFNIFYNHLKFKKELKYIPCKYYILNNYINLRDILKVYIKVFLLFVKTLIILSKKKYFIINNIDCSTILRPLLLKSFFGPMQDSLIYAIGARNFLKKYSYKNFLNYCEFYPSSRSFYYFLRSLKFSPKIITINHANFSHNDLFFSIKKDEFCKDINSLNFSPIPDIYFTQGIKYFKFLKKTIPHLKTYPLGSLKIELCKLFLKSNINIYKIKTFKKKIKKKIILILPSLGDSDSIISVLNQCNLDEFHIILKPHPYSKNETIAKFKNKFIFNFYLQNNLNNIDLAFMSQFVIVGYTSVGLEMQLLKNNILRTYDVNFPPMFDMNDGIKVAKNPKLLQSYLDSKLLLKNVDKKNIKKNFFYKYDKNSSNRLFKII